MIKTEEAPVQSAPPPAKPQAKAPIKIVKSKVEHKAATTKQLREFGLLVGGIFLGLGGLALHHGKPTGPVFTPIGAILVVLGAVVPGVLGPVYRAWMGVAEIMGKIMTSIILRLFYFLYMTPHAAIMRMTGQDPLNLKIDKTATSYWVLRTDPKPGQAEHFTNQF